MSNFRIGQKVVCIYVPPNAIVKYISSANAPKVGGIYSIREIKHINTCILLFAELDNSHLAGVVHPHGRFIDGEPGFRAEYFRPLVSRPTSIAIFQKMLLNDKDRNKRELARLNEERGAPMELPFQ